MLSGCEQADKPLPVFTAATEGEVGVDYKGNILTGFHVSEAFYTYSDMSFDITVTPDIETASATIAPSKDDRYLATCIEAEFYNAGMGDDEIIDMLLDMFKDNLEANTYSGVRTISFSELDPGTDYFVVAFGVNTETGDLFVELVELDEAGTSDDFALFDEYFDSYMGSKSFVKCINAGI